MYYTCVHVCVFALHLHACAQIVLVLVKSTLFVIRVKNCQDILKFDWSNLVWSGKRYVKLVRKFLITGHYHKHWK